MQDLQNYQGGLEIPVDQEIQNNSFNYTISMIAKLQQQLMENGSVQFTVRVRPGAKATRFVTVMDDGSLKIDLHATAEEGKANKELISFLAESFSVPKSAVAILSGQTARQKLVTINLRSRRPQKE